MSLEIGSAAPDFTLLDTKRQSVGLESLKGRKTLIVFMPFPFTKTCTAEVRQLRDNVAHFNEVDANVVVITCDTVPSNEKWAELEGLDFPILSDYWPHGDVSQAYGTFNNKFGVADRTTFALDPQGIITDIITSDAIGTARDHTRYDTALA